MGRRKENRSRAGTFSAGRESVRIDLIRWKGRQEWLTD